MTHLNSAVKLLDRAAEKFNDKIAISDEWSEISFSELQRKGKAVGTALAKAGFPVSQYSTTRNLGEQLVNAGFVKCSKPWKRGDIHLAAGHHVTMSVDANRIVHASQSENGGYVQKHNLSDPAPSDLSDGRSDRKRNLRSVLL